MLITNIEQQVQLISGTSAPEQLQDISLQLELYIEKLMSTNFEQFVFLLYKLDISEQKIEAIAKQQLIDAKIITKLIIERQLQKIKTRSEYKNYTAGKGLDEELL
jgi:hypothetical protein